MYVSKKIVIRDGPLETRIFGKTATARVQHTFVLYAA